MNNKGQVLMFGLMMATFVLIAALLLIDPLKDIITEVRNTDNLNCSSTSISTGTRLTCIGTDLTLPFFIGAVITAGFGFLWSVKRSSA